MERLTKRGVCVQGVEKVGCTHFDSFICCQFEGQCSDGCPYEEQVWDRLAAYEDTGADPAEVKAALQLLRFYQEIFDPARVQDLAELGNIDHLRDLLQAERDGRLVILPCKAWDKVWRIVDMASHTAYKDYVREETVRPFGIPYRDITGHYSLIPLDAFGKTVFFTQEEAEVALEGGGYK